MIYCLSLLPSWVNPLISDMGATSVTSVTFVHMATTDLTWFFIQGSSIHILQKGIKPLKPQLKILKLFCMNSFIIFNESNTGVLHCVECQRTMGVDGKTEGLHLHRFVWCNWSESVRQVDELGLLIMNQSWAVTVNSPTIPLCTCAQTYTHRHSSDKWQSLLAVKRSHLIKLGGPGEEVGGRQEKGRRQDTFVCRVSTRRKSGWWKRVTALISSSCCVIYKADLAPWHARVGVIGVYVSERWNLGGGRSVTVCVCVCVCVCVSAYRWVSSWTC